MKIAFVLTNRASQVRLLPLINKFIELNKDVMIICERNLQCYFEVDYYINFLMHSSINEKMSYECNNIIAQLTNVFSNNKPDCIVIHGDRYEQLPIAMSAAYLNIPICHVEGGENSGNIDDKIRNAITTLSDMHFVSCQNAYANLYMLEKNPKNIFNYGMPVIDLISEYQNEKLLDNIFVVYNPCNDDEFEILIDAIMELSKGYRIIWNNPNFDPGSKYILKKIHQLKNVPIKFVKNIHFNEFYTYMNTCVCMIGNSSSMLKEGAFLGTPCLLFGDRQKNRVKTKNVIKVNSKENILKSFEYQVKNGKYKRNCTFGNGCSSDLISYEILKRFEVVEK